MYFVCALSEHVYVCLCVYLHAYKVPVRSGGGYICMRMTCVCYSYYIESSTCIMCMYTATLLRHVHTYAHTCMYICIVPLCI